MRSRSEGVTQVCFRHEQTDAVPETGAEIVHACTQRERESKGEHASRLRHKHRNAVPEKGAEPVQECTQTGPVVGPAGLRGRVGPRRPEAGSGFGCLLAGFV